MVCGLLLLGLVLYGWRYGYTPLPKLDAPLGRFEARLNWTEVPKSNAWHPVDELMRRLPEGLSAGRDFQHVDRFYANWKSLGTHAVTNLDKVVAELEGLPGLATLAEEVISKPDRTEIAWHRAPPPVVERQRWAVRLLVWHAVVESMLRRREGNMSEAFRLMLLGQEAGNILGVMTPQEAHSFARDIRLLRFTQACEPEPDSLATVWLDQRRRNSHCASRTLPRRTLEAGMASKDVFIADFRQSAVAELEAALNMRNFFDQDLSSIPQDCSWRVQRAAGSALCLTIAACAREADWIQARSAMRGYADALAHGPPSRHHPALDQLRAFRDSRDDLVPYGLLDRPLLRSLWSSAASTITWSYENRLNILFWQSSVAISLAIEEFRCRRGRYPMAWSDLQPERLRKVPIDPLTSQPLRYLSDGVRWVCWSSSLERTQPANFGDEKAVWSYAANTRRFDDGFRTPCFGSEDVGAHRRWAEKRMERAEVSARSIMFSPELAARYGLILRPDGLAARPETNHCIAP